MVSTLLYSKSNIIVGTYKIFKKKVKLKEKIRKKEKDDIK